MTSPRPKLPAIPTSSKSHQTSNLLSSLSSYLNKLEKQDEESKTSSSSRQNTLFNSDFSYVGKTTLVRKKKKQSKKEENNTQEMIVEDVAASSSLTGENEEERLTVRVYSIRLSRLDSFSSSMKKLIKQELGVTRLHDITHAMCALYNLALPDIEPTHIYNCICAKKSVSIVIVKDLAPSLIEQPDTATAGSIPTNESSESDKQSVYGSQDCLNKLENGDKEEVATTTSVFQGLYSDYELDGKDEAKSESSDEEDDDDEDDDDEDFSLGVKSFVDSTLAFKTKEERSVNKPRVLKSLVACATLERVNTYQQPAKDEWIIDLELLSVRKKYRGFSLGKYLISLIQNEQFVGPFDAIVTSSDPDAVQFYEKYSFLSDPILNSKYSHIGDLWTNTTKMCYLPPYCNPITKEDISNASDDMSYINELTLMEKDFKRWQKTMFTGYQSQAQLFFKFKQEILTLKAKLCAKNSLIEDLKHQNDMLQRKNRLLQLKLGEKDTDWLEENFGEQMAEIDNAVQENMKLI